MIASLNADTGTAIYGMARRITDQALWGERKAVLAKHGHLLAYLCSGRNWCSLTKRVQPPCDGARPANWKHEASRQYNRVLE